MRNTARMGFLDGVRGWAALAVVVFHTLTTYLLSDSQAERFRPLLVLANGRLAVYVFFVLSGFVLSVGHFDGAGKQRLLDMAIRRYPRLMIPVLASTCLFYVLMRLDMLRAAEFATALGHGGDHWPQVSFQFDANVPGLLKFALWDVFFHYEVHTSYNPVLWTMGIELAGSFLVFALLAVTNSPRIRWVMYTVLFVGLAYERSPLIAFVIGTTFAEIWVTGRLMQYRQRALSSAIAVLMLAGVWLVTALFPSTDFDVLALAGCAAVVVASAGTSARVARLMEARLSQWLGRISFPLYLTHIAVISTVVPVVGQSMLNEHVNHLLVIAVSTLTGLTVSLLLAAGSSPVDRFALKRSREIATRVLQMVPARRIG